MEDSNRSDLQNEFYLNSGFATRALHAGEHIGQPQHASHTGGIYQTSTFLFKDADEGARIFAGEQDGYMYTRLGNPTVRLLEAKINSLEGAGYKKKNPNATISTQAYTTGMAAISTTLMALASSGDTIIMGDVVYGATQHLARNVLNRFGIKTVEINTANLSKVEEALAKHSDAKVIFLETPTNPLLAISDIPKIAQMAKATNPKMKVVVDNTFATPYLQRPLEMGADVVVHSTTKYICGHGTVCGGLATTIDEEAKKAIHIVTKDVGATPSPFDSWLVNIGLKTLPIRMEAHCKNAMAVAKFLENHSKVAKVYYPGLESFKYHNLSKELMDDFGGMISIELKDGFEAGKTMMNNIKLFSLAVSLGCVDSLIQHPASMTHACMTKESREAGGITDGLVRISVGIEDQADLLNSLEDVLKLV